MRSRRGSAANRQARGFRAGARRVSGLRRAAWRALTAAAVGGWAALAVFHVWLFWGQWQDGRLSDPVIAAKWGGSVLLLGALALLHRSGRALLLGRQALAVWTLAGLVHVGAGAPADLSALPSSSSPTLLFVVPSLAGAALLAGTALLKGARRARRPIGGPRPCFTPAPRVQRCSRLVLAQSHALRAPPPAFA